MLPGLQGQKEASVDLLAQLLDRCAGAVQPCSTWRHSSPACISREIVTCAQVPAEVLDLQCFAQKRPPALRWGMCSILFFTPSQSNVS